MAALCKQHASDTHALHDLLDVLISENHVLKTISHHVDAELAALQTVSKQLVAPFQEKSTLINNMDHARTRALQAQKESEDWRAEEVNKLYKNVTDAELDDASRWIAYAQPFSEIRSCISSTLNLTTWMNLEREDGLLSQAQIIHSDEFVWDDDKRRQYISLHAFHSTGIEGNVLSLHETQLVVDDKPLFPGFKQDVVAAKAMMSSITEVRNFVNIFDELELSHPQRSGSWTTLDVQRLVDINSAITRNMGTPTGLRVHAVSIGHARVLLPQADEVPRLIDLFLSWLNGEVKALIASEHEGDDTARPELLFARVLALACDAHTRFVHIHPFSDGNGRLARILSARPADFWSPSAHVSQAGPRAVHCRCRLCHHQYAVRRALPFARRGSGALDGCPLGLAAAVGVIHLGNCLSALSLSLCGTTF